MKKSLVYGIIVLFATASTMVGCGKSKSASNPSPANNTNSTVNQYFQQNPPSTTTSITTRQGVVINGNEFNNILGNTGTNGIVNGILPTSGVTGHSYFDQLLGCALGSALQGGVAWGLNELFGNSNTNVNINGTCIAGYANNGTVNNGTIGNGIINTNGLVVQTGSTFNFSASLVSSSEFRGTFSFNNGSVFSFAASRFGSNQYYDAARRILITISTNPSNTNQYQLRFWYKQNTTATPRGAAYVNL